MKKSILLKILGVVMAASMAVGVCDVYAMPPRRDIVIDRPDNVVVEKKATDNSGKNLSMYRERISRKNFRYSRIIFRELEDGTIEVKEYIF